MPNESINLINSCERLSIFLSDPFSDPDDKCDIIPHLIRGLVSIATEKGRSGPAVL